MEGALEMRSFHTSLTTSNRWRSEETPGEGGEAATQAQATEGEPSAPSLYGAMPREVGIYMCVLRRESETERERERYIYIIIYIMLAICWLYICS
jgi:hypothetical protein